MRAAYERVLRTSSEKTDSDEDVVTTFIIKSDVVPALWAGRRRFSVMKEGFVVSILRRTGVFQEVVFVCCN